MSHWKILVRQASDVTNYCENPSFETATTGWAAGTNWTLTRGAYAAFRGLYHGQLVSDASAATIMAKFTPPTALTASTTYYVSAWVRVVAGWDGGNIRIGSSDYASSTESYTKIWTSGTDPTGQWVLLKTTLVLDSDNAGTIDIETTSAPGASKTVRIDGMTISTVDVTTFDGDTANCYWTGAEHASTSVAPAYIRNVGVETDLDSLNLTVLEGASGIGMPPVQHVSDNTLGGVGAIYRKTNVLPRIITLQGYHAGTSRATLHSYRKDILDLIYPNATTERFYLRYYGANSQKPVELECVYDAGYEYSESSMVGFNEDITLRCIAFDPMWYELPQENASLTTRGSGTFDYLAAKVSGDWSELSSTFDGAVYDLAYDEKNDILYAGGAFTTPCHYIAKYQNGAWADVGAADGLNAAVYAVEVAPDGDVYIGGEFTDLYGASAGTYNYIVRWDGTNWNALGTGMNGFVHTINIDRLGRVYVGGVFTTGNSVTLNRIGYWNGTTFVAMDSGMPSGTVREITFDVNNDVYVCGSFPSAGSGPTTVNYITKWDGTAYSALGSGLSDACYAIEFDEAGNLYAGGDFTTASGITVNRIALWTGSGWYALNTGMDDGSVRNLAYNNGLLWLSGTFTAASGLSLADRVAIWNGSQFVHTDVDLPGTPTVYDIIRINKGVYENIYLGYSTTGTAVYSVDTTVTNNSSSPVYPTLLISNVGGAANTSVSYLKNESTGATVWMDYTLQIDEQLILDFNPNHFRCWSNYFGNVSQAILGGSDLNWYLRPGTNVITCFTPDASITAGLYWRTAHWSVDGVAA